ncbi:hypothetical protein MKEN_01301300 [Mycena kentingensis (nom. inval.)]|nr:hypothetical protein MKEN_01301300 [Mycena kentingensis (nom. inval.)]
MAAPSSADNKRRPTRRIVACFNCRHIKAKCVRMSDNACTRCRMAGIECQMVTDVDLTTTTTTAPARSSSERDRKPVPLPPRSTSRKAPHPAPSRHSPSSSFRKSSSPSTSAAGSSLRLQTGTLFGPGLPHTGPPPSDWQPRYSSTTPYPDLSLAPWPSVDADVDMFGWEPSAGVPGVDLFPPSLQLQMPNASPCSSSSSSSLSLSPSLSPAPALYPPCPAPVPGLVGDAGPGLGLGLTLDTMDWNWMFYGPRSFPAESPPPGGMGGTRSGIGGGSSYGRESPGPRVGAYGWM